MSLDEDGRSTPTKFTDMRQRIPSDQILLILQNNIAKTVEKRNQTFHILDEQEIMKEASFIFRRIIMLFASDESVAHSLSLLWKYVIVNVDMVINSIQEQLKKF